MTLGQIRVHLFQLHWAEQMFDPHMQERIDKFGNTNPRIVHEAHIRRCHVMRVGEGPALQALRPHHAASGRFPDLTVQARCPAKFFTSLGIRHDPIMMKACKVCGHRNWCGRCSLKL